MFSLPARFAAGTGVWGALVAWAVAGAGMLMLAFVFQRLAIRAPHLDAGVYAYAKAGFGEYAGFFSALGYWGSACVGETLYWILARGGDLVRGHHAARAGAVPAAGRRAGRGRRHAAAARRHAPATPS